MREKKASFGGGYDKSVFGFWKLQKLLLLAYAKHLLQYKSSDKASDQEIYKLWESLGVFDR